MGGEEEEDGVFLMVVDLRTGLEAEDRAMRRALWGWSGELGGWSARTVGGEGAREAVDGAVLWSCCCAFE